MTTLYSNTDILFIHIRIRRQVYVFVYGSVLLYVSLNNFLTGLSYFNFWSHPSVSFPFPSSQPPFSESDDTIRGFQTQYDYLSEPWFQWVISRNTNRPCPGIITTVIRISNRPFVGVPNTEVVLITSKVSCGPREGVDTGGLLPDPVRERTDDTTTKITVNKRNVKSR